MTVPEAAPKALYQHIGLILGPVVAIAIAMFGTAETLPREGTLVAAVGTLMAIWWATEAIPVAVTALLPMVLFPVMGISGFTDAAAPYAHPIIFLFFGGFVIALVIERCGLHRRIALSVFAIVGANARALIGGFMIAAALVSMWISNSSTTLMLLPIAVSVVTVIAETMPKLDMRQQRHFGSALLLGLAYAATIGGLATLVGTPPNAFLVGFMSDTYGVEISFARWMLIGVPIAAILLPMTWFALTRIVFPVKFDASEEAMSYIRDMRVSLGRMSKAEVRTFFLFLALVLGWIFRPQIGAFTGLPGLTDSGIALTAAFLAFVIPSGQKGAALMNWETMIRLPWGVLILFGGGLALASAVSGSGLALWIGTQLAPLGTISLAVLVIAAVTLVIFLTELTSNLGTTATFLPVIAAIATQTGQDPLIYVIPVTLAASCAFMLPVATPPNAIVFSSGLISIPQMVRAGLLLNVISVILLSIVSLTLVPVLF